MFSSSVSSIFLASIVICGSLPSYSRICLAILFTPIVLPLIIISAMCYGPLAALMVELFPTRIRYTSMSLPYHIGNGWFGGFLPTVSFALVVYTGDIFYGLWYPIVITGVSFVVGMLFLKETRHVNIDKV